MTDVSGKDLNIGDIVAFADRKHTKMFIGVVESFTSQKVRIDSTGNEERGFYQEKMLKDPKHLSKIE